MIDFLLDRRRLEPEEKDYLDVLSDQVERYEQARVVFSRASHAEMLQHLIEANGITPSEVAKNAGVAEATIAGALTEKRRLSRGQIGKLAKYFGIAAKVFS